MQEGWSKKQFIESMFSFCSEELAVTHFSRTVGCGYLVATGYKVAQDLLHHDQSMSEEAFPREELGKG